MSFGRLEIQIPILEASTHDGQTEHPDKTKGETCTGDDTRIGER
jgi:hypothetical protein